MDIDLHLDFYGLLLNWMHFPASKEQYIGEQLDKVIKVLKQKEDIPENVIKSPSNTLYRAVLVALNVFKKEKPLKLKNRKYSSWTYDLEAAKEYGDKAFIRARDKRDFVLVILKRKFLNEEIMLNIPEACRWVDFPSHLATEEKEIIVKNVNKNFLFQVGEIILYKKEPSGVWIK